MGVHRGSFEPRSSFAVSLVWALREPDALVPAYALGGQERLRDAQRRELRRGSGELRRR